MIQLNPFGERISSFFHKNILIPIAAGDLVFIHTGDLLLVWKRGEDGGQMNRESLGVHRDSLSTMGAPCLSAL
ncbi:hypothetical protein OJAV_G00128460 [Oryzias javanicus]|uniref:Uncharacterized protein n=1 Tax=Oryzias javanicus TaxID=123683 RepID=A0A3S2MQX6_ORYJA|nr:hypothetical protein OJAV_G00128460 [Oryzias javanicus]